jgi:ABC-2 type transport system permease protein
VLFPYPTGISQKMGAKTKFTELVRTADSISGTIEADKLEADRIDERLLQRDRGKPSSRGYILAAWIRGEGEGAAAEASEGEQAKSVEVKPTAATKSDDKGVNVIYVADIDLLGSFFVQQRNEPNTSIQKFRFDNVPFVCNLIDAIAGETRYLEIRKRKPRHSTLKRIEDRAATAREEQTAAIEKIQKEYDQDVKKADDEKEKIIAEFRKIVEDIQKRQQQGEEIDQAAAQAAIQQLAIKQRTLEKGAEVAKARRKRELDLEQAKIERERDRQIQQIQNEFKLQATVFPPILPLLVGVVVWAQRRIREREGVSRTRMRL